MNAEARRQIHLARSGYAGEGVLLALASSQCLARSATIEDSSLARDRQALAFAWEVWFPLAAEELVMDFVVSGRDVFAVAVQFAPVATLVQALEDRGVAVQSIVPAALLALQGTTGTHGTSSLRSRSTSATVVLWGNHDLIELFLVRDGKPTDWRIVPAAAHSLARELEVLSLTPADPLRVVAYDLPSELLEVVSSLHGLQLLETGDRTVAASAIAAGHEVLAGQCVPWIELRRGALAASDPYRSARRAIRFATTASIVFLIALSAALLVRSQRFQSEVLRCQNEQVALYRKVFPGNAVPIGVRSRLESEYARLVGESGEDSAAPPRISALATLYDVLSSLPDDLRYRVLELRLGGGRVYLEGTVRSHGDADRIAASLRQGGFDVELPHSQQLADNTVSVQLDGVQRVQPSHVVLSPTLGDGL